MIDKYSLFPGLEEDASRMVGNFPHQDASLWSIASSLKRIADALDDLVDERNKPD